MSFGLPEYIASEVINKVTEDMQENKRKEEHRSVEVYLRSLKGTSDDLKQYSKLVDIFQKDYDEMAIRIFKNKNNAYPSRWFTIPPDRRVLILLEAFQKPCLVIDTDGYKLYQEVKRLEDNYMQFIKRHHDELGVNSLPSNWGKNKRLYTKKRVLKEAIINEISIEDTEAYKAMLEEENLKNQYISMYNTFYHRGAHFPKYWAMIDSEQQRIDILREACEKEKRIEETELYHQFVTHKGV